MDNRDVLLDAALCIDDCLIMIYPELFRQENIEDAKERFSSRRGIVARLSDTAEDLRILSKEYPFETALRQV